jgi:hypothetical protein
MNTFYEPRTQKALFANAWAWLIACLIIAALIGAAWWSIATLTASTAGQAGAYRLKQSTQNRVFAQQTFEQEYADYNGYLAIAKTYTGTLNATQRTELSGLRQVCITTAQNYNADAHKYLLRDFKSFDLPQTLDASAC